MPSSTRGSTKRVLMISGALAAGVLALPGASTAGASTRLGPSLHPAVDNTSATANHRPESTARRLHFDVRFSPFNLVDVDGSGPDNFSDGDEIVFHDRLFRHGRRVGDEGGSCVIVNGDTGLANCTAVIRLPHGQIAYQFLNAPPPDKTFVITGGTGRYVNAGGTGRLHEDGTAAQTGTLTLRLVR